MSYPNTASSTACNEPSEKRQKTEEDPAVSRFREYLRIQTVQPNPDYVSALKFLEQQATEIGLKYHSFEVFEGKPVVIMTWEGTSPGLPTLMLNSHMDVVPVYPEKWSSPPFAAEKRDNGDIIARGSQDMKSVGMQYLEAIRCLKLAGFKPLRTCHVTFVPDEEIGGALGMKLFIKTEQFKQLNVGFGLDEGLSNPKESFTVYYGERTVLWFKATCTGNPGHGSRFIENTAAEKLRKIINSALDYRDTQKKKMEDNLSLKLGEVTSINMNIIEGGVQANVVPSDLSATFDVRVTPSDPLEEIVAMIEGWVNGAGSDCTLEWVQRNEFCPVTDTDPSTNPWWKTFKEVFDELNITMELEVSPVGTDARFLRQIGILCIGFSPMNNTAILLHDHNEYLNEEVFLKGIEIYRKMIESLTNIQPTNEQ